MIYRVLTLVFFLFSLAANAQILRDINYQYQYNPETPITFKWRIIRHDSGYEVVYDLHLNDTTQKAVPTLEFETRESTSEKSGNSIPHDGTLSGSTRFTAGDSQTILVAKVTVPTQSKAKVYFFHKPLPKVRAFHLSSDQKPVLNSYVKANTPVIFSGFDPSKQLIVSYYDDTFPAAAPPFSSSQARVSKTIKQDSSMLTDASSTNRYSQKGLYLVQVDTSSAEGLAFRVEDDYPKLGKIESLMAPLIYISTKQEAEKLKQAGNDKRKFDQVVLSLTGNEERARNFMRSYYKRVEMANQHFSSYKEGWKTDRGMIYIIFGVPDEVYLFEDREVWEYKNEDGRTRFQFMKSPTVFDPENYVLIRDKKFTTTWYETVDLWRKARF